MSVEAGQSTELRCLPPMGVPPPRVYWLRNNIPVDIEPDTLLVSSEGHLLIGQAKLSHQANYTCVAENIAAKRLSEPVSLTVYGTFVVHGSGDCFSIRVGQTDIAISTIALLASSVLPRAKLSLEYLLRVQRNECCLRGRSLDRKDKMVFFFFASCSTQSTAAGLPGPPGPSATRDARKPVRRGRGRARIRRR